jgi:hypothetical protein
MSTPEVDSHPIDLQKEDCAIVFHSDGTLNVYVPSREQGEAVPPQMLYTLLVQEMLKDQFMLKVLTDRVVAQGILGKQGESTEENSDA